MREKFIRFMQGRYGMDHLSRVLLGVGLGIVVLSMFLKNAAGTLLYTFGWIFVVFSYFRIFSKNIPKRYAENQAFYARTCKLRSFLGEQKNIWKQRKTHHIYTCPSCLQKIRIPKGKGKIEVKCPKCGTTFIRKS